MRLMHGFHISREYTIELADRFFEQVIDFLSARQIAPIMFYFSAKTYFQVRYVPGDFTPTRLVVNSTDAYSEKVASLEENRAR